jgi:hypothetical protein
MDSQCNAHGELAVEVGILKTKTERNEKDVQEVWSVIHQIQEEIKKMLTKIAYIVGIIAALNTVAIMLIEFLKK